MSDRSFLEKLLGGASVEWVPLGEIVDTLTAPAKVKKRDYLQKGATPIVDQGAVFIAGYVDDGYEPIANGEYVIFGDHSEHIKYVDFAFVQGADGLKILKTKSDLTKYVYHAFLSRYHKELNYKRHWSMAKETLIPIPCPEDPEKSLAIQTEIVRILETFAGPNAVLTAALTDELEARKKQYSYYRDQLLSFDGCDVKWKTLDEIGEFIRGKRFTKSDYVEAGIPVIHYGEIYTHYGVFAETALSMVRSDMANALRYAEHNDVVIAGVSETVEDVGKAVAWLGREQVAIHDDSYAFRHEMNPKFIAYAMQTNAFHDQKAKHVSSGKIKRLLIDGIKKVKLPVPYPNHPEKSLAEQARIVAILDKFNALTTSLSEGLPREIKLRQQQYEYYRDMLLSFPKPGGDS